MSCGLFMIMLEATVDTAAAERESCSPRVDRRKGNCHEQDCCLDVERQRPVSNLIWPVTMSLDGFIAGRDDSMDWVVAQWSNGGDNTRDIEVQRSAVADQVLQRAGAILGGRRWYDVAVRKFEGYDGSTEGSGLGRCSC